MNTYFSSEFKLGVLGAGQLGKMLFQECLKWDIQTLMLDPDPKAPCAAYTDTFVQGNLQDFETVYQFGKTVDVLTIEIENVNLEALKKLQDEGVKIYPSPDTLENITSKAKQKIFYQENEIPTADFLIFENKSALQEAITSNTLSLPFVWKAATGGYDGKGVSVIKTIEDLTKLPDTTCVAEHLVAFEKELAITIARNPSGQVKAFPVVEMEFHPTANQVEYVLCPANICSEITQKATEIATKVSKTFQHVGLLAIEMFLTKDGDILVNEVAPRPHNSGHLSIEANYVNQFEQHLRAVLDLTLGDTRLKAPAVMINLVGEEGYTGNVYYKGIEKCLELNGVTPHIYGKKHTKPFRKMGHITITAPSLEEARQTAQKVKEHICVITQ